MIGQICNANFHPCEDVRDDVTRNLDVFGNQSNQIFCDLTGYMIYFSEYKQNLVRFHLRSHENEKRYFSVVLFRPNLSCKFGKINFFDNFRPNLSSMQAQIIREKQLVEKKNKNVHFRPKSSVTAKIKMR